MKKLMAIFIIFPTLFGLGLWGWAAWPTKPVAVAQGSFVPSAQMIVLGQRIGLTVDELKLTHAQVGSSAGCNGQYFVACFDPATDTITISEKVFTSPYEDPATTLGYEYAHFVWKITPESERAEIEPAMNAWYMAHKARVNATQSNIIREEGAFGSPAFEDELHSIACTEVSDNELAPNLLTHCAAFLPNRMALRNLY